MGSAGDFSREAAPTCNHAQLSTHNAAGSARGSSIPDLRLVSAPTSVRKTPNTLRAAEAPIDFIQNCRRQFSSRSERRLVRTQRKDQRFLSTKTLLGASSPFCFIAHFPDILKRPPAGRRGEMMVWDGWWVGVEVGDGNRRPYQFTKA